MAPDSPKPTPITRRNLLAATAWSAPVVAVAVAAPAAAASGEPVLPLCGTTYQLSLLNPSTAQLENTSLTAQTVALALLTTTNTILSVIIEDQATFESAYLPAPSASGTVNSLSVAYSGPTATSGTISITIPAGATYSIIVDVSFPPSGGTGSLTPADGGCASLPLVFTSA